MFETFFDFIFSRWTGIPMLFWFGMQLRKRGLDRITFECMTDDRISYITDKQILQLWNRLTKINIVIGWWYSKVIGPYFIVMSVLLFVMLWIFQWDIPSIFAGREHIAWLLAILAAIAGWMAFFPASWNPEAGDPGPELKTRFAVGADIQFYKEVVFNLYRNIEYQTYLAVYYDKEDKAFRQLHLDYLCFAPHLVKWGVIAWYSLLMGWCFILVLNTLVKNLIL